MEHSRTIKTPRFAKYTDLEVFPLMLQDSAQPLELSFSTIYGNPVSTLLIIREMNLPCLVGIQPPERTPHLLVIDPSTPTELNLITPMIRNLKEKISQVMETEVITNLRIIHLPLEMEEETPVMILIMMEMEIIVEEEEKAVVTLEETDRTKGTRIIVPSDLTVSPNLILIRIPKELPHGETLKIE